MERKAIIWGALLLFLGVGAGAFGAHVLESYFSQYPDLQETYDTAVQYQMLHGLGLFVVAWVSLRYPGKLVSWAGILFLVGILLFSGSLYLLVFTRIGWLGAITPLGGLAFLAGWLCLAYAAWRN